MNIELPAIPSGILVLLSFFAPYAVAVINNPKWAPTAKKTVAIVVSLILTAVVMVFYYFYTGDILPDWPVLILLAITVSQASYALLLKPSATSIEQAVRNKPSAKG